MSNRIYNIEYEVICGLSMWFGLTIYPSIQLFINNLVVTCTLYEHVEPLQSIIIIMNNVIMITNYY